MRLARLALAALVAGCSSTPPPAAPPLDDLRDARAPLRCAAPAQCDAMWQALQVYVSDAGYRLEVVTDVVLQASTPPSALSIWSLRATRSAGEIRVDARCDTHESECHPGLRDRHRRPEARGDSQDAGRATLTTSRPARRVRVFLRQLLCASVLTLQCADA